MALACPVFLAAQATAPPVSSYEGQNVASLVLAGRPNLDYGKFMALVTQQQGTPLSSEKIAASLQALKATGAFQDVQLELTPDINGVRVLFLLRPAVYIGVYRFPGATTHFQYVRLLQIANYREEQPYTTNLAPQAEAALTGYFHRSGFFLAQVRSEIQVDEAHGLANLIFHTDLGPRAKFGTVVIEGATPEQAERLQRRLRSLGATVRATSVKPGKNFVLPRLERATRYLQSSLGKQGYLTSRVRLIGAEYDPNTNRADVKFTVETGPEVKIRVQGARVWPWKRNSLIPMYTEYSVDPDLIREGQRNLQFYFQSKGFFDAAVHTDVQHAPNEVVIAYQIGTGPKHRVDAVRIDGNQHIPSEALLDHVPVKPARFPWRPHGKFSERLLQTSTRNLAAVYQAAGFSSVKVTPEVQNEADGNLNVTFRVEEGPQDVVDTLEVTGNNTVPVSRLAPQGLRLAPGKPYSETLVREDRNSILAYYLRAGYLTVTLSVKAQAVKDQPHRVMVTYQIYEGPQVYTAAVLTEGREHTQQFLVDRTARMRAGAPLTENDMLSAESRLYGLGIFDWAAVDLRQPVDHERENDAVVKLHEAKRNTIGYSFGFEIINRGGSVPGGSVVVPGLPPVSLPKNFVTSQRTFYGPRGSFDYTRSNLRGQAESFSVGVFAGRLDQRATATYRVPFFHGSKWEESTSLSGEHNSENPIYTSTLWNLSFLFRRDLDVRKTKTFFLRYEFGLTAITELLIPDLVPPDQRRVRISQVSGSYVQDTRDNPLDAHRGTYHSYELGLNAGFLGSNFSYAWFHGQTAYYRTIPARIVWANSLRLGLEKAYAGSVVPLSEKFFSGGGSTLRGFSLDGAGPQQTIPACGIPTDPSTCSLINVPTGGTQLLILNTELRVPMPFKKNLSVVAFYDGGNVFASIGFHGQYTNSIGGGLRYTTPIGPIRLDIGHNLNAPPGIKATQVFFTVGQAF